MCFERVNGAFGDVADKHVGQEKLVGGLPLTRDNVPELSAAFFSMTWCSTLTPRCQKRCIMEFNVGMRCLSLQEGKEAWRIVLVLQCYPIMMY